MTHSTLGSNGASLEDCHTNFFALADLCGLKWRRLSTEHSSSSVGGVDPLSEPVLWSFAKCLAADLLCVWRRVTRPEQPHRRELWLFWYGEEPDLAGLVSPELSDTEQGSWENGLSYECRSLLFKALHNLIQRCLLSRGFTRMGRWFLQPCDSADKDRGGSSATQLTFAFHFFVHGDSTVCASVDVRQHPAIHRISRQHVLAAQSASQSPCKVILGPFGLAGVLTGQGFKETDVATQSLLTEWHQFYPLPLFTSTTHRGDATPSSGDEEPLPCALEVIVGGIKLRYPSAYVFVVETDEVVPGQQGDPSQGVTPATPTATSVGGPYSSTVAGAHGSAPSRPHGFPASAKPGIPPGLTAVLTPPTSPCEPGYLHSAIAAARNAGSATGAAQSQRPARVAPPDVLGGPHAASVALVAQKAKVATWQDSLLARACDEEAGAGWEFCDPCGQTHCFCFRCTRTGRPSLAALSGTGSLATRGPSPSPSGGAKKPSADKSPGHSSLAAQTKPSRGATGSSAPSTPFHRRSPVPGVDYEGAVALVSRVASGGLPQLSHQPAVGGPPPSVGSCSHPGTPLLLSEGPASQASQADPAMPTLSPHPPPRDEPRPSPVPGASPAPAAAEPAKDRQPGEQLLSPSSLLEVKPPLEAPPSCSPGGSSHPWGGPGSVPSSSAATPLASSGVHAPPSVGTEEMPGTPLAAPGGPASLPPGTPLGGPPGTPAPQLQAPPTTPGPPAPQQQPPTQQPAQQPQQQQLTQQQQHQGLKRPCLPAVAHEALMEAEALLPLGSNLLYDYSTVYLPAWDIPPCKRPHMGAPRRTNPCDPWRLSASCRQAEPGGDGAAAACGAQAGEAGGTPGVPSARDPYEFHDEADEDPAATATGTATTPTSQAAASQQGGTPNQAVAPVVVKEEEKDSVPMEVSVAAADAALPSADSTGVGGVPHAGGIGEPATPGSQGDLAPGGSPPTPRHPGFTRVEDLKVTDCDLENIFDTSSSDESSDDPAPSTPSSTKPPGATDEPITKSKNSATVGILGTAELIRMFPTPPSLEHNAAPSPSCPGAGTDLPLGDTGDRTLDPYGNCASPGFDGAKDWSYVYKVPKVQAFVSSQRYAPLAQLPSAALAPLPPIEVSYKPSWQQHPPPAHAPPQPPPGPRPLPHYHPAVHHQQQQQQAPPPVPPPHLVGGAPGSAQEAAFLMRMGGGALHHPGLLERHPSHHPGMEERACYPGPAAMMGSPGAAAIGYEIGQGPYPALMGGFPVGRGPCLGGPPEPPTPEADSLLVNLLLSDSLLELFRDHNFASCTLCVCNMNIKGADVGVYLPPSLVPTASEEAQYKCTCGFSAVVNRHLSHRAGLFYQDELDITGLPYEAKPGPNARALLQQQQQQQARLGVASRTVMGGPTSGHLAAPSLTKVDEEGLMDYVQNQCLGMSLSPCSVLHKTLQLGSEPQLPPPTGLRPPPSSLALLQALDGCEVASGALETVASRPLEESLRSSCLHHWPYLHSPCPASSLVSMGLLRGLQPLLQDAVHKKRNQGLWEVTYRVAGPLTWRQFHRLAGRGTEDQCEPQPIPSLLVGYDRDWLALSPFALKYWDKLLLEPYSPSRDVAYVVVVPDSEAVLSGVRAFFQDLSATYQALNLGRHCPLSRGGLREGLLRVSCTLSLPSSESQQPPDDDWLGPLAEGPLGPRLRLFARACKLQLGPHLATQSLDRGMLEGPPNAIRCGAEARAPLASPRPPPTPEAAQEGNATPRPHDATENSQETSATSGAAGTASGTGITSTNQSGSTPSSNQSVLGAAPTTTTSGGGTSLVGSSSAPGSTTGTSSGSSAPASATEEGEDEQQPPALVVYLVEPFTLGCSDPDVLRLATLGLHRCFSQLLECLPEPLQSNTHVQILSLDSILGGGGHALEGVRRQEQLRAHALSVFYQCARLITHQSNVKSLTGFGPAAAQDEFLKSRPGGVGPVKLWSPPFVLAPQKDKQTELGEMFGERREKCGILFCAYCLTEDQRWLLASISNDKGDLLDNCSINIEIPNRTRRKKVCVRRLGLHKLLEWVLGVAACGARAGGAVAQPWRLVVGRLGRVGHGELREWAGLLGRRSLLRYSRRLRELCHQCAASSSSSSSSAGGGVGGVVGGPCVLSACLVSLEPDGALRLFHDQHTPDDRFSSSCQNCDLNTPQDATATHILVFPTSATTQSSQATFQQDHMDPLSTTLGDDDEIFKSLTEDIAVGNDFNDILNWTDSPEAPCSPTRRSSPPGSPGGGILGGGPSGRQSPFQHGSALRGPGSGGGEPQEEPMQLLQQPLALGYYVSTAPTGPLPRWFWATCPHLRDSCPVFLKSALLLHCPTVHQNHDDILHGNTHMRNYHPLDSNLTTDVLRYVLEGYNTLSWLSLDPHRHDRQSCLPLHIQNLMKLYHAVEALL
ncbi:mediator complex subunit skuld isoform X2 [Amblyomma americanum]